MSGSVNAAESAHEMQWCRWCNDFQPGERHSQTCENRPVQCSWCERRMSQRDFASHQYECRAMPDYQVAQEQERARREREWKRALRARERAARRRVGDDSDDDSDSETASERRARRAARRTARDAESAAPQQPISAVAAAPAPTDADDFERFGRRCVWCKKPKPKSHDPKCPSRRVLCKACHSEVLLSEKDAHRVTCRKRPSRSAAEALENQRQRKEGRGVAFKGSGSSGGESSDG